MNNRVMRPGRRKPGAPSGLVFTVAAGLAWQKPFDGGTPLLEYRVYADGELIDTVLAPSASWSGDIAVETAYAVSAVNAVGEGPKSAPVIAA